MHYVRIFTKTFASLAAAALVGAQAYDWSSTGYKVSALHTGLLLLAAVIAALIAAGWAYARSPATTALQKATRQFIEVVVSGAGVLAFNEAADVVDFGKLLTTLVIGAVLSFGTTYLMNVEGGNQTKAA
jgi:hypothetical protein